MKKLVYIAAIAAAAIVAACGGEEDNTQAQDYTSFVIRFDGDVSPATRVTSLISAHHDSIWHKIAEHGELTLSQNTHFISEETILPKHIDSIYIFWAWYDGIFCRSYEPYILQKNKKNILNFIDAPEKTIINIDSWEYPK